MLLQPTTDQPSRIDQPSTNQAARRAPRRIRLAIVVITASAFLASAGLAMANDGGIGSKDLGAAFGFGGPGVVRGGIGGQITITGISGNDVALKTTDGWTRTISVSSSTIITKAGQTIAVGDLTAGDTIRFSQTASSDGTYTIDAIVVVVPTVGGQVTAKGADSITITRRDGSTTTIHVSSATTYRVANVSSATLADISVGMIVMAEGPRRTDGSIGATTVVGGAVMRGGPGFYGPGATPNASPSDTTNS